MNFPKYSYDYIAAKTNYLVPVGTDIVIPLYLQESNSDQSTNSLLVNEGGLYSAGARVSLLSGSSSNVIRMAETNGAFDDPSSTAGVNAGSASIIEFVATDGVLPSGLQVNGVSDVLVGDIEVKASQSAGDSSTFTVSGLIDPGTGIGTTLTNTNFYDLNNNVDPNNPPGAASLYDSAAGSNFTVTATAAIPEPATISLLLSPVLLQLQRRRRPADTMRG